LGLRAFASACLLLAASAFGQTYDVVGVVSDEEKGEPIANVQILTKSGKELGYTKSNGRFEITVNNRGIILVFKRHTYKDVEKDLSLETELIGLEVTMESDVIELAAKDTVARRNVARDIGASHSMEELELMQGMKIDLNDHLRQLPGVSGMNEFTNDISVWGSRTGDVTHYLGQTRIPALRHLDFGFPGNQSVLNPRLLKSVTVADNLAKGPISQGNASALVYDMKEGDPNNIHADVVFGTVNREFNATGYWGGRTFLLSGRYLEPTFLSNLGSKFFTEPKDVRNGKDGTPCKKDCVELKDPFTFRSGDLYAGTFYRDSSGHFGRLSLLYLDDSYTVRQDVGKTDQETAVQTIVSGTQDAILGAYEGASPLDNGGDVGYSLSVMHRKREEGFRDSLPPTPPGEDPPYPWYPRLGDAVLGVVNNDLGIGDVQDFQTNASLAWNSGGRVLGAAPSIGVDFEYLDQTRVYRDINQTGNQLVTLPQDYALTNALYRLKWSLSGKRSLEASAGAALVFQGNFEGAESGFKGAAPEASLRYTHPLGKSLTGYAETSLRQNTTIEPAGYNRLEAYTTSSVEGKLGANGDWGPAFHYTGNVYSRFYKDPHLPTPEVFWNYEETRKSDYAYANGGNVTAAWTPSHHVGMNVNASVVQGDYHIVNDDVFLPWEASRTLDLVTNLRLLPRRDSLVSVILTYTASNGAPLYEYIDLYDRNANSGNGGSTLHRTVMQSSQFPEVSRQRTDIRINLDLASKWRPLDAFRLFFEADNLFSYADGGALSWLGGDNRRRRGWTRANANGDLTPVVTKGMGLFIMFGFEGKLLL
jgi:hypothetical protein